MFSFGCSEVNSNWLITSELANQRARKVLFTCVVCTNTTCVVYTNSYYYYAIDGIKYFLLNKPSLLSCITL